MPRKKVSFAGHDGQRLVGLLELPDSEPRACAVFAHCFTCSKDIAAASRISRALTSHGLAVLRFDFTGLGNSDGDFANTNFSTNLDDLIEAAKFLESEYEGPALLIGHSLGGAAVLAAAHRISSVTAVVTIGAPSSAKHVEALFADTKNQILDDDEAQVSLGGREFTIKRQFIEDIDRYSTTEHIGQLRKALLVFHSPVDNIVSIDEASRIYAAARHPKSFISLDKADHLLSNADDSTYVAEVISSWMKKYLPAEIKFDGKSDTAIGDVRVEEANHKFLRKIFTDNHSLLADEPVKVGGQDLGPDPYELLLAGLGACTSMTIRMYANRKNIALEGVDITLRHRREHHQDCEDCADAKTSLDVIEREIHLSGDLSDAERKRLMEIADRCPVHRSLENEIQIRSHEQRSGE